MKILTKISRTYASQALLFSNYSPRTLIPQTKNLTKFQTQNLHSKKELDFSLVEMPIRFSHQEYLNNLKSFSWVSQKIEYLNKLLKRAEQINNTDFKHLRSLINEILHLCKVITDARSYHQMSIDLLKVVKQISHLIILTFSKGSNLTHESLIQQQGNSYVFIQFSIYFNLCRIWRHNPPQEVLQYYMHSYMNILFDRNFLRYVFAYEAVKQIDDSQIVRDIITNSEIGINRKIGRLDYHIKEGGVLNPYQMGVYLKYIRNEVNRNQNEQRRKQMVEVLKQYVNISQRKWEQIELHCENMVYCLFLLLQQGDSDVNIQIYQWLCYRYRLAHHQYDNLLQYLTILNSHQDKLTCLKVDIFLNLFQLKTEDLKLYDLRPRIKEIILSIHGLNAKYWRYKYIFWLLDSILNKYPHQALPYIKKISTFLGAIGLRSNESISSLVIFLRQLNQRYLLSQLSDIIEIHYFIADWLVNLPKSALVSQNPSDLCELLTLADRHPTLQLIYTPLLANLLELSLGHFLWADHTKLYYYGIRFGVQHYSQQAQWNMQYVRRYILNQYSTMGLRRRQIPEDSYFYKIIGITTPEKFYKNYLKHDD